MERLVYDATLGDPELPHVSPDTFKPAKPETFLGLLVDFGWLKAMPPEIPQFEEDTPDTPPL